MSNLSYSLHETRVWGTRTFDRWILKPLKPVVNGFGGGLQMPRKFKLLYTNLDELYTSLLL